ERNPERLGQNIDVSMLDSVFSFMPMQAAIHFTNEFNKNSTENLLHGDFPFYSVYRTKDDKFISLGIVEMKFWNALCKILGRDDLKTKQMAQGEEREQIFKELQKEFLKKTRKEWSEILKDLDVCSMPIKTIGEACEDPQIKNRNMVVEQDHPKLGKIKNIASPIKYSRTPLKIRSLAPKIGQHTKEMLRSMNYSEEEIKALKKEKIF
ncbi:MAG: CoA transferase, partial [archaeon]|nr:CoA transferase [archaeon]